MTERAKKMYQEVPTKPTKVWLMGLSQFLPVTAWRTVHRAYKRSVFNRLLERHSRAVASAPLTNIALQNFVYSCPTPSRNDPRGVNLCPYQTYSPAEPRNARRDPSAAKVVARTPVLMGCGFVDFTALADENQSYAGRTTLSSYTAERRSSTVKPDGRPPSDFDNSRI